MKPHQVRAQSKRAAQSNQARKTTGKSQTQPQANGVASGEQERLSWSREQSSEHGITRPIDPDIPGLYGAEWSDGALLDFVAVAVHDAELVIVVKPWAVRLGAVFALAQMVVRRTRARGMRPCSWGMAPAETWWLELPGAQSAQHENDVNVLCEMTTDIYPLRCEIVRDVIPALPLARAVALADALVIAESNEIRNGCAIDSAGNDRLTPVQRCSRELREQWLAVQSGALVPELPSELEQWAKGGAR